MKTNNQNSAEKRTVAQVNSILKANDILFGADNLGDGRTFEIKDNTIKTRIKIRNAGFILQRNLQTDKFTTFLTW